MCISPVYSLLPVMSFPDLLEKFWKILKIEKSIQHHLYTYLIISYPVNPKENPGKIWEKIQKIFWRNKNKIKKNKNKKNLGKKVKCGIKFLRKNVYLYILVSVKVTILDHFSF